MVFTQEHNRTGIQWKTSFEHDGKAYVADVCHPIDYPWRTEGLICEIGDDGYIILGHSYCVEVDEVSKSCLQKLVEDFIAGKIDTYVQV